MKTLNDLVDKLNDYYDMTCRVEKVLGDYNLGDDLSTYICFDNGDWDILSGFGMLHHDVQKEIMDFIYTTDSNHWFDELEKKYNIIISKNPSLKVAVAYFKPNNDTSLKINESATQDDLKDGSYQFTDDEIEKFKKAGNSTFNQIVDLGKVEVTNED